MRQHHANKAEIGLPYNDVIDFVRGPLVLKLYMQRILYPDL